MKIRKVSPDYTDIGFSAMTCIKYRTHRKSKKIIDIASIVQPECWIVQNISGLDLRRAKSEEQGAWMNMQEDGWIPLLSINEEPMGDLHGHS